MSGLVPFSVGLLSYYKTLASLNGQFLIVITGILSMQSDSLKCQDFLADSSMIHTCQIFFGCQ